MTIRIPKARAADRILGWLGKRRAVRVPSGVDSPGFGPYAHLVAEREGFIRALLRSRSEAPPPGWFYPANTRASDRSTGSSGDEACG